MPPESTRPPAGLLLISGLGWYVAAWVLVFVSLDADRVVGTGAGFVGGDILASGVGERAAVLPMFLALAIGLLASLAGIGLGWAVLPLVAAGLLEVIGLASTGSWLTLVAMGAVVLGTLPVLARSMQDHLWSPEDRARSGAMLDRPASSRSTAHVG